MKSFEESVILLIVTKAKVSLLTTSLASQLLKIIYQREAYGNVGKCQVHIKGAVQAIQECDFGEDICSINRYIQKKNANQ